MYYHNIDNLVLLADGHPISKVRNETKTIYIQLENSYDIEDRNKRILTIALDVAYNNPLNYKVMLVTSWSVIRDSSFTEFKKALKAIKIPTSDTCKKNLLQIHLRIVNKNNIELCHSLDDIKKSLNTSEDLTTLHKKSRYYINAVFNNKYPKRVPKKLYISIFDLFKVLDNDGLADNYKLDVVNRAIYKYGNNYYYSLDKTKTVNTLLKLLPTIVEALFSNTDFINKSGYSQSFTKLKEAYLSNYQKSRLFEA